MPRQVLKFKPLVEAIFELKWALPPHVAASMEGDPHYRLLLGRFSERVEGVYPFHEPLPTAQIPDGMVAHTPQHRFRVGDNKWPLLQVGPGLMTVNETEGYTWDDFRERCAQAVSWLYESHPAKQSFALQELTLRYIDAVEVDFEKESLFAFLKDKMRTTIGLPGDLFSSGRVAANPTAFNWQAAFPHNDPGGVVTLRLAVGQRAGRNALIWETLVQAARDRMPSLPGGFSSWLEKAHELTDEWFFTLIDGELQRRFSGDE